VSIRVVIADDQPLVRAGLRPLLDKASDIEVVGEAVDGAEAVRLAHAERPDIVLMDIRMPVMDGVEATRRIVAELPEVRVIVLTTFELEEYVFASLRAGASGFLGKDVEPDRLRDAVRVVAAGEALLTPSVTRKLISQFVEQAAVTPADTARLAVLTDRERDVLSLVAKGLSNDDIGRQLFMSPATARTHIGRTMQKLDLHDRAQLVVLAYQTGLVSRGD
jgi:DNA-binding NarL/FixJ family response regulator